VVKNKYPYLLWDGQRVTDHIMIVPKKHCYLLGEFSAPEFREYVKLVAEYDKKGYSTYARGKDSSARSIHHQHTHLIRTDNRPLRFLVFFGRPYRFWYR
jgi:diadenosine tetraphosphate (Ap4A) HIT family hydrolase